MRRARHVAALFAALCLFLACPGAALAAVEAGAPGAPPPETPPTEGGYGEEAGGEEGAGGVVGPIERPQLLLVHGGSFLYDDPTFEPLTRERAIAAGFVPHYVSYPLDNLPAAVERVRAEARRLRQRYGLDRVYAYGSSAGGTLVSLLAGQELVSAAVAKAPVSDLAAWDWPTLTYGPEYWTSLGMSEAARERLSPALRPELAPLLVIQGRADNVVPPSMNETFAASSPQVKLWMVAGGHTTDRMRPFLVTRAMHWLARIAARKMSAARKISNGTKKKP
ncbi:MAG: prolyl oligopeptidase family serine peptidase [Actinobacteria bacterium]|nr:prolyl oligopeptidase family serine peptidase [Actinomycetota bacterium]